jgi:hypothetical protein
MIVGLLKLMLKTSRDSWLSPGCSFEQIVPCDQIKKINRVGENGGLNQSKHQNNTIQVTRFFFLIDRTLLVRS